MTQTILIKRGLEANRSSITPALGELIWTTDAKDLWVGDGSTAGGVKVTANIEANYIPNSEKGVANGVAILDTNGTIPNSALPPLAISSTFVAGDETTQLGLDAQEGDICVRTDLNKSYIRNGGTAGDMTDWQELLTPTDSVTSVNGKTGVISLTTTDITEGTNLYYQDARVDAYIKGATILTDISDVDTGAVDGQVLSWDNTNSKWVPSTAGGIINTIDDIGDVAITSASNGDYLRWDSATGQWVNTAPQTITIDDLSDVDTTTNAPTSGQVLKYDGTNWVPNSDNSSVASLDDIGDVNVTGVTDGQFITWNNTAGEWQASDLPTGADGTFKGLTDTPANYTGSGGFTLKVKTDETGIEFVDESTVDGGSF